MKLKPLTNRSADDSGKFSLPEDGWYQLAPAGEYPATVAGLGAGPEHLVQVLDDVAFTAMANRFAALAKSPNFAGVLVDFDHFSLDLGKSSEAAGWLMELANRDGSLWGKIRWTDQGETAVTGGRFRFISPVFDRESAENLGNRRVRPTALLNAALTNDPNLKGMVPLSNRNGGDPPQKQETAMKKQLATLLGLDENATDQAFIDKIQGIKNRAAKADAAEQEVKDLKQKQLETQVEADLEEYKEVIENRDEMKKQLLANRDGTIAVLKSLKPAPAEDKGKQIPNRKGGKIPDGKEAAANAAEAKKASAIRNRANVIAKEHGCSYRHAFSMAARELQD